MPRRARKTGVTGVYHVMLRGVNRNVIFHDEQDFGKFIKVLDLHAHPIDDDGIAKEPSCYIYAYCLMSNHVHLLIQEHAKTLSELMKSIGISFVSYVNKRYDRCGPLFQDRFLSEPVDDVGYFIKLLTYIHQNPLRAEMVNSLDEYPWSSWYEYKFGKPGLCVHALPFSGISWEEIKEMVCQINETVDEKKLGIDYSMKMTDEQARNCVARICENEGLNHNLKELPKENRNYVIIKALENGIGVRQLSRITFIAHSTIHRLSQMLSK